MEFGLHQAVQHLLLVPNNESAFKPLLSVAPCTYTCSDVDKRTWLDKLKAIRALYEDVNSNYWQSEITANSGDTKRLWRIFSGVLGEVKRSVKRVDFTDFLRF